MRFSCDRSRSLSRTFANSLLTAIFQVVLHDIQEWRIRTETDLTSTLPDMFTCRARPCARALSNKRHVFCPARIGILSK